MQSKIQRWGNSSAIRLPAKALAAAGIDPESDVDIQAAEGRLVIQLSEKTQEQVFDKLLSEVPGAEKMLAMVRQSLRDAITTTDQTTHRVDALCKKLEQQ